jgi:hypothetical protein
MTEFVGASKTRKEKFYEVWTPKLLPSLMRQKNKLEKTLFFKQKDIRGRITIRSDLQL